MKLLSKNQAGPNLYELEIQVEEAEFAAGLADSYKKNAPKLSIPGFRKGKAPKNMVMKMVGEEYFYEDAVNLTYHDAYEKAVKEAGLEPVDSPDVELKDVSGQGYTFVAKVTNKPVVELEGYKGLKATRPVVTVTDEEIDAQLAQMAERNSRLVEIEDRAAETGDTAEINYEGFLDGVPFRGGKGEGHPLVLGSGQFIPGFEEQVAGHNIGEEFDVNVTFPEDYHEETLKGKAVVFKVTITGLKRKEVPAVDDELAKDVSEFDTLQELKDDLRQKLQAHKDQEADEKVEDALVAAAAEKAKVEIPQVMIDRKINDLIEDFAYQLQSQGLNLETYLKYTGTTPEDFQKSLEPRATEQVRATLTLEKIAALEQVEVTEAEVDAEYQKTAEQYHMEADKVRALISAESVISRLSLNKAIDILKASAVITDEKPAKAEKKAPAKKPAAKKAADAPKEEKAEKKPAAKKPAAKKAETAGEKAPAAKKPAAKKAPAKKAADKKAE